jgi:hypothetical protein
LLTLFYLHSEWGVARLILATGVRAQGGILKKSKKKSLSTREKFREILETKYNVLSIASFLCGFCLHITEYEQIRRRGGGGGAKFYWAQGHRIPKYGPGGSNSYSTFLKVNHIFLLYILASALLHDISTKFALEIKS